MSDYVLQVRDTFLDSDKNVRIYADIDGCKFYIRAVKYFWSIMFRHELRFKTTSINSPSKGPSLLLGDIFERDNFLCNVANRALMVHRANNSGECVVSQSAGCLIPITEIIDLKATKVIAKSNLDLVAQQVKKLEGARITCSFFDIVERPEVKDYIKTLKTGAIL